MCSFFTLFFTLISVAAASISPIAQCVEWTSLNVDVETPSKAGRSNNWLSTFTACARVNAPFGLKVVALLPVIIPRALTLSIACAAQCVEWTSANVFLAQPLGNKLLYHLVRKFHLSNVQ